MSGVELIIFGAGPAVGLFISLIAWLYEGSSTDNSIHQPQYNPDSI